MATGTAPPLRSAVEDADRVVHRRLEVTARELKWFELLIVGGKLLAGLLAGVLAVVIVDHWIWPLPAVARAIALLTLLGTALWLVWTRMVPLLLWKINPVYVARLIERSTPELKNSLVNCLTYRGGRSSLARFVERALSQKAAADLAHVPQDAAIDRKSVLRSTALLGAIAVLFLVYCVASPKSTWVSIRRLLQPWHAIDRPTRVHIGRVTPGDSHVLFGDRVTISAEIEGVVQREQIVVVYSTRDRKTVDRRVVMEPGDGPTFAATLPAESTGGLESDVSYRIEAGDARSRWFHLTIEPEPAMLIERVVYQYPPYTQLPNKEVVGRGSIEAIDGTRVTVYARANQPIGSATLLHQVPVDRQPRALAMQHEGKLAHRSLWLDVRDGQRQSYRLDLLTKSRHRSKKLVSHDIKVIPDLPPEIEIRFPKQSPIEVPLNGSQAVSIRAIDPDFALTEVAVLLEGLPDHVQPRRISLLKGDQQSPPQFVGQYVFRPAEWNLKVGDRVTYRALAVDNRVLTNRSLKGNQTLTPPQVFVITAPVQSPPKAADDASDSSTPRNTQPRSDSDAGTDQDKSPKGDKAEGQKPQEKEKPDDDRRNAESASDDSDRPLSPPDEPVPGTDSSSPKSKSKEDSDQAEASSDQSGQDESEPTTSDGSSDEEAAESDSTSPDDVPASHDGDVIERALEYLKEKQEPNPDDGSTEPQDVPPEQQTAGPEKEQPQAMQQESSEPQAGEQNQMSGQSSDQMQRKSGNGEEHSPEQAGDSAEQAEQQASPADRQSGEKSAAQQGQSSGKQDSGNQDNQSGQSAGEKDTRQTGSHKGQDERGQQGAASGDKESSDRQSMKREPGEGSGSEEQSGRTGDSGQQPSDMGGQSGEKSAGQKGQSSGKQDAGSQENQSGQSAGEKSTQQTGKAGSQNADAQQGAAQGDKQTSDSQSTERKPGEGAGSEKQSGQSGQQPSDMGEQSGEKSAGQEGQSSGKQDSGNQENQSGQTAGEKSTQQTGKRESQDERGQQGAASGDKESSDRQSMKREPGEGAGSEKPSGQTGDSSGQPSDEDRQSGEKPAGQEGQSSGKQDSGNQENQSGQSAGEKSTQQAGKSGNQNADAQQGVTQGDKDSSGGQSMKGESGEGPGSEKPSGKSGESGQRSSTGDRNSGGKSSGQSQSSKSGSQEESSSSGRGKQVGADSPGESGSSRSGEAGTQGGSPSESSSASSASSEAQPSGSQSQQSSSNATAGGRSQSDTSGGQPGNSQGSRRLSAKGPLGRSGGQGPMPGQGASLNGAPADEANLEYTRKATNMVLEYLKKQQSNPDPELLKRLKWTPEQLRQFVDRWEALRKLEERGDSKAKKKLERIYRSLGLRPGGQKRRAVQQVQDRQRGLSDAARSKPPASYADKFRAYKRSVAQ